MIIVLWYFLAHFPSGLGQIYLRNNWAKSCKLLTLDTNQISTRMFIIQKSEASHSKTYVTLTVSRSMFSYIRKLVTIGYSIF